MTSVLFMRAAFMNPFDHRQQRYQLALLHLTAQKKELMRLTICALVSMKGTVKLKPCGICKTHVHD